MGAIDYVFIYALSLIIVLVGLFCVSLLLIVIYQYSNHKAVNRKVLAILIVITTIYSVAIWEPVVTTLIVIPSMCRESGGLHVYKKVKAEGFFNNIFVEEYLTKYSFSYIEYIDRSNYYKKKYVKKIIGPSSSIVIGDVWDGNAPQSRYRYFTRQRNKGNKSGVMKHLNLGEEKDYILDAQSNEIIGEVIKYYYSGKGFRYLVHRMLADKEGACWTSERDPKNIPLPVHVLQPNQ
ncbi:MAG: hypothetical protein AB2603_15035 [Candidatus Thiodiazotropha endolucinida]